MQKIMVLTLAVGSTLPLVAQRSSAPADWTRVQALKPGTAVSLRSRTFSHSCKIVAVTLDSLTCAQYQQPIARTDVQLVRIHRRLLSTAVGLGVGAGLGAGIGAATNSSGSIGGKELPALVFGVGAGVVGAAIGALTDFFQSTLYRAP